LPHPKTFTLDEMLQRSSPDSRFFVRYKEPTALPSFITPREASAYAGDLRELIADGKIQEIEEGIRSSNGGCVVQTPQFLYVEIVAGHLSGLLRRGWCQLRHYASPTKTATVRVAQFQMVEQCQRANRTVRSQELANTSIDSILESVKGHMLRQAGALLYEFIVDAQDTVFFVDYKQYEWSIDFSRLFHTSTENSPYLLGRNDSHVKEYDGDFELQNLDRIDRESVIRIGNRAALSHFITYALQKGVCCITR